MLLIELIKRNKNEKPFCAVALHVPAWHQTQTDTVSHLDLKFQMQFLYKKSSHANGKLQIKCFVGLFQVLSLLSKIQWATQEIVKDTGRTSTNSSQKPKPIIETSLWKSELLTNEINVI